MKTTPPKKIEYIPKTIHHIAPTDKSRWNSKWIQNYDTWIRFYPIPEYTHMLWDDKLIEKLVMMKYPSLYNLFISYKTNAHKEFFAKYIILYFYGGICVDMGTPCRENKFNAIDLTTINFKYDANYKNNLSIDVIASPQYHDFWNVVLYFANKTNGNSDIHNSIGRELINMCYIAYSDKQNIKFSMF